MSEQPTAFKTSFSERRRTLQWGGPPASPCLACLNARVQARRQSANHICACFTEKERKHACTFASQSARERPMHIRATVRCGLLLVLKSAQCHLLLLTHAFTLLTQHAWLLLLLLRRAEGRDDDATFEHHAGGFSRQKAQQQPAVGKEAARVAIQSLRGPATATSPSSPISPLPDPNQS